MIKDILVHLDCRSSDDVAKNYAVALANSLGAHVSSAAITYQPVVPGTIFGSMAVNLLDATREENLHLAKEATAKFEDAARGASVNYSSQVVSALVGEAGIHLAKIARQFDLTIVRQERDEDYRQQTDIIEGVMFGSGRPLIVIPYINSAAPSFDRVMICWDRSQHAARAIADAMPLLTRAKRIEIVTVATAGTSTPDLPGAEIAKHLSRHGLKVETKNLVADEIEIGDAILSYAGDSSTDFIVMGGYGHSRVREFVFGGVTRQLLRTMTVPVLFSH